MDQPIQAQLPAVGILKRNDWGDTKTYTVPCSCCSHECEHSVWVKADDNGVTVTTYTKQKTKWWSQSRWKTIWTLITRGYVEYQADIIMTQQQAVNYAATLNSAVDDVAEFRNNNQQSNLETK
jgi:hypothetical protein